MASFIVRMSPHRNRRRLVQEPLDRAEQRIGRLHVRDVAAVLEHHEASIGERAGQRLGSLERNRVLPPVQNEHGTLYLFDALQEVEVTKTFPYLLLDATCYPERGEIACPLGVGEVAGNRQLERALAVRVRITLAQPGLRQLLAKPLNRCAGLPLREVRLESRAKGARDRCRLDEYETRRRRANLGRALEGVDRIEQREQPAPRIAHDRQGLARELTR